MATITHMEDVALTTNVESYVSDAFIPAANDLLIVLAHIAATAQAGIACVGSLLTFTRIDAIGRGGGGASDLVAFVADALAAASSQTVTITCTGDAGTGCAISVEGVAGMTKVGLAAIRQSKTANAASGTPAVTFDIAALTGNPTIAAVGNVVNPATMTEPSGMTELVDIGFATPTIGLEVAGRDSGFTGTTITWGSDAGGQHCELILELDASSTTTPPGSGGLQSATLGIGLGL